MGKLMIRTGQTADGSKAQWPRITAYTSQAPKIKTTGRIEHIKRFHVLCIENGGNQQTIAGTIHPKNNTQPYILML